MKFIQQLSLWVLTILFVQGCASPTPIPKDTLFDQTVGFEKWDKNILLTPVNQLPRDDSGDNYDYFIELINRGDKSIFFESIDLGVRIFIFDSSLQSWIEIKNRTNYLNNDPSIIPPSPSNSKGPYANFFFSIASEDIPTPPCEIRVMVEGEYMGENGNPTTEKAMNFIDMSIMP